jgi:hypothetical protein
LGSAKDGVIPLNHANDATVNRSTNF